MRALATLALFCLLPLGSARAIELDNARAERMAKSNATGVSSLAFIRQHAKKIKNAKLRAYVESVLTNPAPTFMSRYPDAASREAIRAKLVEEGLLAVTVTTAELFPPLDSPKMAPMSFLAAPGGTPDHHHDYPGGLAEHTAFNLQGALDLEKNYKKTYGVMLDPDLVIAPPILHDAWKAWVFQWTKEGSQFPQAALAGTGCHHPFGVAESIHRGMSAELVVAHASAHDPPGIGEAKVVAYVRAASILAGVDPVEKGYLKRGADGAWSLARLPGYEATVNHLSDHDYVFTDPASKETAACLERLIREEAAARGKSVEMPTIRWARARIKTQVPQPRLYVELRAGGDAAVKTLLASKKIPLLVDADGPLAVAATPTAPR